MRLIREKVSASATLLKSDSSKGKSCISVISGKESKSVGREEDEGNR